MTNKSQAFELQIHRICELLEGSGAQVTWNEQTADPDNPAQKRQIDIAIRRGDKLTLVECRMHRVRQDVNWIEELMGRRISLRADSVIGVSSSGFTQGAANKAQAFGVILRDLQQLTDAEILNWGRAVALTVYFYQYDHLELSLLFNKESIPQLNVEKLKIEFKNYRGNQSLFNAAAEHLDTLNLLGETNMGRTSDFKLRLQFEDFHLCNEPVVEVGFSGNAKLVARDITCPSVTAFGPPGIFAALRDVFLEKFSLGESALAHSGTRVAMHLDLSGLELPPCSQLRYVKLRGSEEMDMEIFETVGAEKLYATSGRMVLDIVSTDGTHESWGDASPSGPGVRG